MGDFTTHIHLAFFHSYTFFSLLLILTLNYLRLRNWVIQTAHPHFWCSHICSSITIFSFQISMTGRFLSAGVGDNASIHVSAVWLLSHVIAEQCYVIYLFEIALFKQTRLSTVHSRFLHSMDCKAGLCLSRTGMIRCQKCPMRMCVWGGRRIHEALCCALLYLFRGKVIPASRRWIFWSLVAQSSWGDHNTASSGLQQVTAVSFSCYSIWLQGILTHCIYNSW